MPELKCQDCDSTVDVVNCTAGVFVCLQCVNATLRARRALDDAAEDYEKFVAAGGRMN